MEQAGPLQFGPYVVLEQIGAGGMGAVYRARDRRLQRDVAIKVLHRHLAIAGAQERFLREARAVSSLNHPNICTVFDIGEENGDPYLVMELLEGQSLKDRLEHGPMISQVELENIACQAALALAAAHAKGIVHRDIKPANLFLVANPAGDTQLKVLDFGLAKLESDRMLYGDAGLTRTGATVGTVEYMSPEQARGEPLDPRSDLFSLGAVLYELATGDVPFRGATSAVVFAELLGSDPVPPRISNTQVSTGMDRIIRKLLEKRLYARMQSAAELTLELRALHAPPPATAAATKPAVPHTLIFDPLPVAKTAATAPPDKPSAAVVPDTAKPVQVVTDPAARAVRPSVPSGMRATADRMQVVMEDADGVSDAPKRRSGWGKVAAAVLLLAAGAGGYVMYLRSRPAVAVNVIDGALQVTPFANSTGDATLGDAPGQAMVLLLRGMPSLQVVGYTPVLTGDSVPPKDMAAESGASEYLAGEIARDGQGYRVHGAIVRVSDGSTLAAEDALAGSIVEIPRALSQLAMALRSHMGETPDEANSNTVPLDLEATASIPALNLYSRGLALEQGGDAVDAAAAFTKALAADAGFAEARLHLADALRNAGAEVERRRALEPLRGASPKGSACLQMAVTHAVANAAGALETAQKWAGACAMQWDAHVALSRELLVNGRGGEAQAEAEKAVSLAPLSRAARTQLTVAAIAQDHYELALKEQMRGVANGTASPGLTVLAAYLRGDATAEAQAAANAAASHAWADEWNYVTYLVNRGKLGDAVRVANEAAARAEASAGVASSAGRMRSRVAAMEAVAGHCDAAAGGDAYLNALAAAWCHRTAPTDGIADPSEAAIARAALAWGAGDVAGTTAALDRARSGSDATVVALLRGEAHLLAKESVVAIGDFRAVITHRGAATLTGLPVYPAAHAGLATAYKAMGDEPNSQRVQADLKQLWKDAAPTEPLLHRAR